MNFYSDTTREGKATKARKARKAGKPEEPSSPEKPEEPEEPEKQDKPEKPEKPDPLYLPTDLAMHLHHQQREATTANNKICASSWLMRFDPATWLM